MQGNVGKYIFRAGKVVTYGHLKIHASSQLTFIRPQPYFYPVSPHHKPWASNLSAEESQKLRKTVNEGSPLWRRKSVFLR